MATFTITNGTSWDNPIFKLSDLRIYLERKDLCNYPISGLLVNKYRPFNNLRKSSGEIVEFNTNKLDFDITSPVDITIQPSYDGTVNLILNDDKNKPRLINSRFTVLENNQYSIIDRDGNNDTNIYNDDTLENEVSLYKQSIAIPDVYFLGLAPNGNMKVGNYVFYFKYVDDDGNETDFIEESGIVSCFIGESPRSIRGGIDNENSFKSILFRILNCDANYNQINVYYTRSTSSEISDEITTAYKINKSYSVVNSNCNITISGYESITPLSINDINLQYNIVDKVKSQEQLQNVLFFANTSQAEIDYVELEDLSLRILPKVVISDVELSLNVDYINTEGYYNPTNIYYNLGYWNYEIYRFGIVYILKNNTLSPVFNIRGRNDLTTNSEYTAFALKDSNENRQYIELTDDGLIHGQYPLENSFGVVRLNQSNVEIDDILGINFEISKEVLTELNKYVNGYFFVRQKRIPSILSQALVIGYDNESKLPVIPFNDNKYYIESFLNSDQTLSHNFSEHKHEVKKPSASTAICPDYTLNRLFLDNYFTGDKIKIRYSDHQPSSNNPITVGYTDRLFMIENYNISTDDIFQTIHIKGVSEDTSICMLNNMEFKSRAGEREQVDLFEYINNESIDSKTNNIVRGSFNSYLGLSKYYGTLLKFIDIYVPGYDLKYMNNYFTERQNDSSPYYAISKRTKLVIPVNNNSITYDCYRGDCFICNYTHRMNWNFQDPETPINDRILKPYSWKENYVKGDNEKIAKINRADINAVNLGHWITFKVRSSNNISLRCEDISNPAEEAVNGHPRTFYPYREVSASSAYNVPESYVLNKGYNSTTSDRYNVMLPRVPYLKNYFHTRISYSNVAITDAFDNGFRTFRGTAYRDYPINYGGITKIVSWFNSLICVFEHAVGIIPVNERLLSAQGVGGNVYINTQNLLAENVTIINDTFGSQWANSVIKTPNFIYGIDTTNKKIWRTNGTSFETISDLSVQKFLNDNITLQNNELTTIIGIRDVSTHYNKTKGDVMFTFYDTLSTNKYNVTLEEKVWHLCYNELLKKWITFYSWVPLLSSNIYNYFYSFDREKSKNLSYLYLQNPDIYLDTVNRVLLNTDNNKVTNNRFYHEGYTIDSFSDTTVVYRKGNDNTIIYTFEPDFEDNYKKVKFNSEGQIEFQSGQSGNNLRLIITVKQNTASFSSTVLFNYQNSSLSLYKHGGINNKPSNWYGKQHPFEIEFVVVDSESIHKIFETMNIISNRVAPESFHYSLLGEQLSFNHELPTIFWRQEAWNNILQLNGKNILYSKYYEQMNIPQQEEGIVRSTMFPLYYFNFQPYDVVYNNYQLKTDSPVYNYANLSGTNVSFDGKQYYLNVHCLAVDAAVHGRLRGNIQYKNDYWSVQIPSINFVQSNESLWHTGISVKLPTLYTRLCNVPYSSNLNENTLTINKLPQKLTDMGYSINPLNGFDINNDWNINTKRYECNIRDKYLKVRLRYDGSKLTFISGVITTFNTI